MKKDIKLPNREIISPDAIVEIGYIQNGPLLKIDIIYWKNGYRCMERFNVPASKHNFQIYNTITDNIIK